MSREVRGTIMVLVAGIAWGISGVSGQYLMSQGWSVNTLTALRLLISGIALTLMAYVSQKEQFLRAMKSKEVWLGMVLFSLFGLLLNQYAYLSAIYFTNAGTATVLQYLTPVLIMIMMCLKTKVLPSKSEFLAIVLALVGTFVIATHGHFNALAITPKGLFWGLLSAVTYALYILLPAKLIRQWGSLIVIGPSMLMSGVVVSFLIRIWDTPFVFSSANLTALVGIVGIGTIFAYTVFLKGTSIVGQVKGSLLASVEPVASVFFGIWLMNEAFYVIDILGMTTIVLAVYVISIKDLSLEK